MYIRKIIYIIGILVILFSISMIIPIIVALIYQEKTEYVFIKTFFIILIIGLVLWIPNKHSESSLRPKEGFLIVTLFWIVLGSAGALPFIFFCLPKLCITDALFESFSGLTTTGATTFIGLDHFPKSILFYRQMLQWLGGMGIVVLAVAIFPILRVGGMQLYKSEMPGPLKDNNKIRPRVAETAKTLWLIYGLLTVLCAIFLWISGMDIFDAISHSFATVSLGGFSTHDQSIAYFHSPTINIVTSIFLVISGCNFGLHFSVLSGKKLNLYWKDLEFRTFIFFHFFLVTICMILLYHYSVHNSIFKIFYQSLFQVASIETTAGFSTDNFSNWPLFLPILLICSSFIGGCAGSTGGGLKVIRVLLLFLQGLRELKRLIHPNAIYTVKLGNKIVPERTIESIWGFFSAYLLVFIISFLLLMATGVDELSAFSSITTTINNSGPALGIVSENFSSMNVFGKWILIFVMLFGRLEIFTLLALFTPTFWKK